MRTTKLIKEITHLSYIDRLKYVKLPTLLYRRFRGDMIVVHIKCAIYHGRLQHAQLGAAVSVHHPLQHTVCAK